MALDHIDGVKTGRSQLYREIEQPINMVEQYAAHYFASKNEIIISAINVISTNTRSGGLNVYMEIFGKRFEMLAAHKQLFETEWEGVFLKDFIAHAYIQGFVVIEFVPSDTMKGELVPQVMPPEHGIVTIVDIPGAKRIFRVYRLPRNLSDGGRGFGKRSVGLGQLGDPLKNVLVYEYNKIMSNGGLNSAVLACMNKLNVWDNMFDNQDVADWYRSHPVWAVQRVGQQNNPDPMEQDHYAEEDLGIYLRKFNLVRERNLRKTFGESVISAAKTLGQMEKKIADVQEAPGLASSSTSKTFGTRKAPPPAYMHHFEMPEGQSIAQPPQADILPNFATTADIITAVVFQVFGIPPQLMFSTHVVHETNAKMTLRLFNERIRDLQKFIEPILNRLYMMIYHNSHDEFAAEQAKDLFTKYLRGANEGKNKKKKNAKKRKRNATEGIEGINKDGLSADADGVIPPGEPVTNMKNTTLQRKGLIEEIKQNVRAYVSFNRTPLTEYEDLLALYQERVISFATFAKHAVSIVGLNEDEIMSDDEREKEWEEKLKRDKEETEATTVDKAKPGAGASSAKKKKKPKKATAGATTTKAKVKK